MKVFALLLFIVVLLFAVPVPRTRAQIAKTQPKPELAQPLQPLQFFSGGWHCDGKFTNGKAISANLSFEPILNGNFLLFHHDDEPPFDYHAWSEWGWDAAKHEFVSTVQDITGGVRVFRSPGWTQETLTWTGGNLPAAPDQKGDQKGEQKPGQINDQKFVFERLEAAKFRVSYSYQKNGTWLAVDSSVCTRVETATN